MPVPVGKAYRFNCVNTISVIVRVVVVHIRESDLRDDETQELCWHGGHSDLWQSTLLVRLVCGDWVGSEVIVTAVLIL